MLFRWILVCYANFPLMIDIYIYKIINIYKSNHTDWFFHDVGYHYAQLGFIVYMPEYKGHGRSDGYYVVIDDFENDLVDECIWIFNRAINKYIRSNEIYKNSIDKDNNYFLSGVSMGGAVAISIGLKQQNKLDNPYKGIIVCSPMVGIAPENIPPKWQIWCMSTCLLPCCPYAKLIPNNIAETLTPDKELQKKHDDNPVIYYDNMALITGHNLLETTFRLQQKCKDLKLPLMIVHGDNDCVTSCDISKKFYDECGCTLNDKNIKIYPGKGHLIYEEEPKVFNDTTDWMLQRIQKDNNNNNNHEEKEQDTKDYEE